ncbi:MAG TPA: DNA recombination protein RmuC, partial [Exilispira sp.]|nr:DNA recombination protein RmuC [Exilispira sp.]
PQKLKLNMDVKFPLDNYLKYLDAIDNQLDEAQKESYKKTFLQDVIKRIDELKGRNYINPEENTVDYALMFIPNEQVYSFINEADRSIIDRALKNKVIICSPITLYAILAIIRQAVENFSLEKTAGEILGLLSNFRKKWDEYQKSVESMGKKLDGAVEEYSKMIGTKNRDLDKQLQKIDEIRQIKGFAEKDSLIGDMTENINIIEIETDERKDKI